jgi:uncharacterized protein (PEP-CTERM system associated)
VCSSDLSTAGARLRGTLDYQLSGSIHARGTEANTTNNTLAARATSELIDRWLFLDASASIGQQAISAFGVQSGDTAIGTANRTEVRSLTLRPSVQGQVGGLARYELSYGRVQTWAGAGQVGDSTDETLTLTLRSARAGALGWDVLASSQRSDFSAGRTTAVDSLRAGLNYQIMPDWRANLSVGRERSDLVSADGKSQGTWGVGVDWIPSDRTRLSLRRDKRFFGEAYSLNFDHRLPLTTIRLSSSRDLSTPSQGYRNAGSVAAYDLLFANLAAVQPDPQLRHALVMQQLAALGLNPTSQVAMGFLTSGVTQVTRHELSLATRGVRTTFTLSLFRSDSRRVDTALNLSDDFSQTDNIRMSGGSIAVAHRLTPQSSLSLSLSRQRNEGDLASQRTDLKTMQIQWTTQLSLRSNLLVGARRNEFDSDSAPYNESALFATYGIRF